MKYIRSAFYFIPFLMLYAREVLMSTVRIAWLVVHPKIDLKPVFLEVPLELEGELPVLLFACLISMTPGTLSVSFDRQRRILLVHFMHEPKPADAVADVKEKLETPLLRIFPGAAAQS